MSVHTKGLETQHDPHQSVLFRVWHFVRHFVEMCLAMCIGGIPLIALFFLGAAQLGYPNLLAQFPELSVLVIGLILSLPMTAWMRFRNHAWRPTLEMASTSIVLGILLVGLSGLGILPRGSLLEWMRSLACPAMLIPMFFRLNLYTGHHTSNAHARHEPTSGMVGH